MRCIVPDLDLNNATSYSPVVLRGPLLVAAVEMPTLMSSGYVAAPPMGGDKGVNRHFRPKGKDTDEVTRKFLVGRLSRRRR